MISFINDACVDASVNDSAQLINRDKLEVQCRYCFQTETQTSPAGPLSFKAREQRGCRKSALPLSAIAL